MENAARSGSNMRLAVTRNKIGALWRREDVMKTDQAVRSQPWQVCEARFERKLDMVLEYIWSYEQRQPMLTRRLTVTIQRDHRERSMMPSLPYAGTTSRREASGSQSVSVGLRKGGLRKGAAVIISHLALRANPLITATQSTQ